MCFHGTDKRSNYRKSLRFIENNDSNVGRATAQPKIHIRRPYPKSFERFAGNAYPSVLPARRRKKGLAAPSQHTFRNLALLLSAWL